MDAPGISTPTVTTPLRIDCVIGTRPEAVKMAPLILALRDARWARIRVLLTGQHRDLAAPILEVFGIHADRDLGVMTPGQSLNRLAASLLEALDGEFNADRPGLVLAQGDTTTVLASSLASYLLKIPFGHVEAGLRTGNLYGPFPEEGNRVVTSHLSALHFAPTASARDNLLREGIDPTTIHMTGNTVIDALFLTAKLDAPVGVDLDPSRPLILITAHRRENFGAPIVAICEAVATLRARNPGVEFLWPVHPNPAVKPVIAGRLGGLEGIHLVEPLEHAAFVSAMKRSTLILTDSGGVQEEAPALGKPVLVLREESERPEAIEAGLAKLVGTSSPAIVGEVERLLNDPIAYRAMAKGASPYGDGKASGRIVAAIAQRFGITA